LIYDHNKQVEQSVINSANLGNFYRYVNGRLSCKSGVGPLKTGSGEVIVSDVEKAEVLNKYFTSVFTVDNGIFPDFGRRVDKNIFINEIDFFSADIVKVITQMKNVKTADPHGFNNCFFETFKVYISWASEYCVCAYFFSRKNTQCLAYC